MKHLSQTVKIGLALLVALFSNGLYPATAAYATANQQVSPMGADKQVFCNVQGASGSWKAQIGGPSTEHEYPLKDSNGNNVYVDNQSQVTAAMDASCAAQYGVVTPVAPTKVAVCGANNDTVTFATTANVTYSQTGWASGSNTVTATANTGYTLSGTSSWVLVDIATAGCVVVDTPVTPVAPTVTTIEDCDEYGSVVFAETEGIEYTLTVGDGREGAYTVTATALDGYVIAEGATATFSGNLGTYTECEDEVVTCPANTEWFDVNENEMIDEDECFKKVFVCKYVGTPFVNERLQTGNNPISVSVNAIKDFNGIGSYFNDAQGRSFVLEFDVGQEEPGVDECPSAEEDAPAPVFTPVDCPALMGSVTVTFDDETYRYTVSGTGITGEVALTSAQAKLISKVGSYVVRAYLVVDDADDQLVATWNHTYAVLDCPGGRGNLEEDKPVVPVVTPVLPAELPHTGPAEDGSAKGLLLALLAAVATYGAAYFAQPKRRYE